MRCRLFGHRWKLYLFRESLKYDWEPHLFRVEWASARMCVRCQGPKDAVLFPVSSWFTPESSRLYLFFVLYDQEMLVP